MVSQPLSFAHTPERDPKGLRCFSRTSHYRAYVDDTIGKRNCYYLVKSAFCLLNCHVDIWTRAGFGYLRASVTHKLMRHSALKAHVDITC